VRRAIRDGALVPGEVYSEVQVAKALGISRTPIREALIELSREGIVEKLPQRGFRLRIISEQERDEVFEVRAILESHLAQRLAMKADDGHLQELERLLDEQERVVNDPSAFVEIDEEFHLATASALGFHRTREMLLTLRGIIWVSGLAAITASDRAADVIRQHRQILERIAARDPEGAARAVDEHIRSAAKAAKLSRVQGVLSGAGRPVEPS
jgi:DNA-binding GntR family transcriptional regulator